MALETCSHVLGLMVLFSIPAAGQQPSRAVQLPFSGYETRPAGSVSIQSGEVPGAGSNAVDNAIRIEGVYSGSVVTGQATAEPLSLSLTEAVTRGIQSNLGSVTVGNAERFARGQQRVARSALLPDVESNLSVTLQQLSIYTLGLRIPILPSVVGPFNYFNLGTTVNQRVADLTAWNNYRAARENVEAARLSTLDSREIVAMAVSGAYLEVIAADARVTSAKAQVALAEAVYKQAFDRHEAGLNAQIDVTRTRVELQTQMQRLTTLMNDSAKLRISLARLIGLPASQQLILTDNPSFSPLEGYTVEDALSEAMRYRFDLKASLAQVRAAEQARKAATSQRIPSLSVNANYGAIGLNPAQANGIVAVSASLRIPIWEGGRISAEVEQAGSVLAQRRAEHQELSARIDSDIRTAFLDLGASSSQVGVAESNVFLARGTLRQARDRFGAGVADSVEVVQAQEAVSAAEFDYISSLFSNNLAKIGLARATGQSVQKIREFLGVQ